MKMPSQGRFAAFALCAAAAVTASPAVAAEQHSAAPDMGADHHRQAAELAGTTTDPRVPVIVPLKETLGKSLPVDSPAIGGSLPAAPVMPPSPRKVAPMAPGQTVPRAVIPSVETNGTGPAAFLEAPVPTPERAGHRGVARLETPSAPLHATGPAAALGLPMTPRNPGHGALPRLTRPDAAVASPAVHGRPEAELGVLPKHEASRLPLHRLVGGVSGLLPSGTRALGG